MTTPIWSTAKNGLPGDLDAVNESDQINQFLGTHTISEVYEGSPILSPYGGTGMIRYFPSNTADHDQPFTMPAGKTSIGRITFPINVYGNASDLQLFLYPDNGSGFPNTLTPISSVIVPGQWMANIAAVGGLGITNSNNPDGIQTAQFNTAFGAGDQSVFPWAAAASGPNGVPSFPTLANNGNYVILLGGLDRVTGSPVADVHSVGYTGGYDLSAPQPQPALPAATAHGASAVTETAIAYVGGTTTGSNTVSTTWVATWDPNTGKISSWSQQTAYPTVITNSIGVSWGSNVYIIGGTTAVGSASSATNLVYFATITNGQLSSWQSGPLLPLPLTGLVGGVVSDWIIITGGQTTSGTANNLTFYCHINSDGTLGPWQNGPNIPTGVFCPSPGWDSFVTDSAFVAVEGYTGSGTYTQDIQILPVGADGIGVWRRCASFEASIEQVCAFPSTTGATGEWVWFILRDITSQYYTNLLVPQVLISAPLSATSLTPGSTYHVLFRQLNATTTDYISITGQDAVPYPQSQIVSARFADSWAVEDPNVSFPITFYDNSTSGKRVHTYDDPVTGMAAAQSTLFVEDWKGRIIGLCEQATVVNNPLNVNPTFTSGTSPWAAVNCTFTQSSAQTHGGYPFSGLITPNGTSASVYVYSETINIVPNQWYQARSWLYSPTGWSNVGIEVNWFDSQGTFLSTSTFSGSLTAATWTEFVGNFQAPATAAQADLTISESGTPAATNTLYLSDSTLTIAIPSSISSVLQIGYNSSGNTWEPVSATQLSVFDS